MVLHDMCFCIHASVVPTLLPLWRSSAAFVLTYLIWPINGRLTVFSRVHSAGLGLAGMTFPQHLLYRFYLASLMFLLWSCLLEAFSLKGQPLAVFSLFCCCFCLD